MPEFREDLERQRASREEKLRRRASPEAKEDRRRSRRRFGGLDREEAKALARQQFPRLFSPAETKLLPLEPGQDVLRYTGDRTAVVRGEGGGAFVVDSTVPLRAEDEDGDLRPVDVGLQREADGWSPLASNVPVRIGERASAALDVPGKLSLGVAGSEVTGSQTANEIYFADVGTDLDAWVGPTPSGARLAFALRSQDSPEEVRLDLSLPSGVAVRTLPDGEGVELVSGSTRVGTLSAPVAFDADEQPVPVSLRVDGEDLVIEVSHRDRDVLYPIAVDPVYENQDSWKYGNGNTAGWRWYNNLGEPASISNAYFPTAFANACCGTGFYIWRMNNRWFSNTWLAEWQYWAPNDYSYIYRADFLHVRHSASNTVTVQGMWSRMWGSFQHQLRFPYSFDYANNYYSVCADGQATDWACDETVNVGQSRGNYVQSAISPSVSGSVAQAGWVYWGGARIWMSDWEPPGLWYLLEPPSGWVTDTPAGPYNGPNEVHVRFGDRGLGMWGLWMDVPGKARQYSSDWGGCSGAASSRCPESRGATFSYAGIPEGTQTVTATGQDVLGRTSSVSRTLKIDRSPPTLTLGGSAWNNRGGYVQGDSGNLIVEARDSYSGVGEVDVKVDGQSLPGYPKTQTLDGGSIIDSITYAFPDESPHVFSVTAKDRVGRSAPPQQFTVAADKAPPTIDAARASGWDDDRVDTISAQDTGSGVKSVAISAPGWAGDSATADPCNGLSGNCDKELSVDFDTSDLPPGVTTATVTAIDRLDRASSSQVPLKVDRAYPDIRLGGALTTVANGVVTGTTSNLEAPWMIVGDSGALSATGVVV